MSIYIKPPVWFWVVSGLALVWNLMGTGAFFMQMMISDEMLRQMPQAQQTAMQTQPLWFKIAFGTSVIAGTLGCIVLLVRKSFAINLFVLSFISVLVQMFYSYILADHITDYGPGAAIMPFMIVIIGGLLIWFARNSEQRAWIY